MKRLGWLIVMVSALAPAKSDAGPKEKKRPNILILIADDWSYPHASGLGTKAVKTPTIDRLIKQGCNFRRAFVAAPSCSPSRASLLTGRYPHALKEGANLWGVLPAEFTCFPDLLERAGYFVGFTGKGWGPGSLEGSGRTRNPAGDRYKSVQEFLAARKKDQPFCYWFGSTKPHRPYKAGSGIANGLNPEDVKVPKVWPDTKEVRSDILDYLDQVAVFDREIGDVLRAMEEAGLLEDTLILVLSDNGMPFPRAKANLYDLGVHVPLIAVWPGRVPPGSFCSSLVSYVDIAPTLMDVTGLKATRQMQGRSFFGLLVSDKDGHDRSAVFYERERHANVRKGDASYPSRAVRTDRWLYIRNFRPEHWPAGDPETHYSVGKFGDIDDGPTKQLLMTFKTGSRMEKDLWELTMGKRLEEELYDLKDDPQQMNNLAYNYQHLDVKQRMRGKLDVWMRETDDPRLEDDGSDNRWDRARYFGAPAGGKKKDKSPPATK